MTPNNKTALITGSNRGLGFNFVKKLSSEGFDVIACSRSRDDNFQKILNEISEKFKNKIYNINFDLKNFDETEKTLNNFISKYEKNIDILINNAGTIHNSLLTMTPIKVVEDLYRVNVVSLIQITQLVVKKMIKNKSGAIINISSSSAKENNFGRSIYSSTKIAVESITKSLSKELSRFNIRVNCIAPGLIDTEMLNDNTSEKSIEQTLKRISSKRIGRPEDISNLLYFLCSKESDYINGEVISIDGGLSVDG